MGCVWLAVWAYAPPLQTRVHNAIEDSSALRDMFSPLQFFRGDLEANSRALTACHQPKASKL